MYSVNVFNCIICSGGHAFLHFTSAWFKCDLKLTRHSSAKPVKNVWSRAIWHLNKCPRCPAHSPQWLKFADLFPLFPLQQTGREQAPHIRGSRSLFQGLLLTLKGLWHAIRYCCASQKVKIISVSFYLFCLTWIPKETKHMQLFFWSVCTFFIPTLPKSIMWNHYMCWNRDWLVSHHVCDTSQPLHLWLRQTAGIKARAVAGKLCEGCNT